MDYSNKKVFITGHTGFKGSWLTLILHELGASVLGYALPPEPNEMFELIGGSDLCNHLERDVKDAEELKQAILSFQPDFIFHLAAQPLVLQSYEDPMGTIETNINGTVNLLDILRKEHLDIPCLVITTDKVYRNEETNRPFKESDALGGKDIYSASKAATELMVAAYAASFKLNVATARAGNVIGGGDFSANRIIPDFIRAVKTNSSLKVRNPDAVRPWQHVLESLSGYLMLGEKMLRGSLNHPAYNFGPSSDDRITVSALINICQQNLENPVEVIFEYENNGKEARSLSLDSSLSTDELGWLPKWNAGQAIKETLDWYMKPDNSKLSFTKKQIHNYFDLTCK